MQTKFSKTALALAGVGLLSGIAATIGIQTQAATNSLSQKTISTKFGDHKMNPPEAAGQVTAISGNTINLTDKRTGTAYSIDTSKATIQKITFVSNNNTGQKPEPQTINISEIKVGDNIAVQGTINGTNIQASSVISGLGMFGKEMSGHKRMGNNGTVTSISGSTITISKPDGKVITVDSSSATIQKLNTIAITDIKVGDTLHVNGQENNGTVSATNIISGQKPFFQNQSK